MENKVKKIEEALKRKQQHRRKRQLQIDINKLITERYLVNEELKALREKNYTKYSNKIKEKREQLDRVLMDLNPLQ